MASPMFSDSCDVVLKDGSTVVFRPSREEDVPSVRRFFESLSVDSQYQRFLGVPRLDDDRIRRLIAETPDSCVLLACCGARIVAVAGFYRNPLVPERAEVAFAIADAFQGRGIGTRLLERLAQHARERHIAVFEADVKLDNHRMLDVFAESGFGLTQENESGVAHLVLSLAPSTTFDQKAARRARVAATASMRPFFEPRSVVVVGASRRRGKIGSEIFHNLIAAGFTGTLSAVHPEAAEIEGHLAYRSVSAIPSEVDLAIIAVPAADGRRMLPVAAPRAGPSAGGPAKPRCTRERTLSTLPRRREEGGRAQRTTESAGGNLTVATCIPVDHSVHTRSRSPFARASSNTRHGP